MTTKYTTEEVKQLYSIAVDQGWDALESNEKIAVGRYCRKHGINRPGLEPQTAPSPLPEQAPETLAPQTGDATASDTDLELLRSVRFIERWPDDIVTTPARTASKWKRIAQALRRFPDRPAIVAEGKSRRRALELRRRLRNAKFVGFQPKGSYRVEIAPDRRHKDCYVVIAQYRGAEQ